MNGMRAEVLAYDARSGALKVETRTGFIINVHPWTDTDMFNMVYYPVRAGYASTIIKFQGAELDHAVVFLDATSVPGAAYTAMSRVRHGKDVMLAGALVVESFTPAR